MKGLFKSILYLSTDGWPRRIGDSGEIRLNLLFRHIAFVLFSETKVHVY